MNTQKRQTTNNSNNTTIIEQNKTYTDSSVTKNTSFDMRNHLDKLTLDGGTEGHTEKSFQCPVCNAPNFKVNTRTGAYYTFSCDCASTEEGKRKIRQAVAPIQERKEKDVRPKSKQSFIYTDTKGNELIKVIREDDGEGHRYWDRHYFVDGKWTTANNTPEEMKSSLKEQITLYNFTDVIDAVNGGYELFIVEGEGVADSLNGIGINAVTNIGGSGKWDDRYTKQLKDAGVTEVIISPDRDKVGVKHADEIANSCEKHGINCKWSYPYPKSRLWFNLPENKGLDYKDYLEDFPSLEDNDLLNSITDFPIHRKEKSTGKGFGANNLEKNDYTTKADEIRKLVKDYNECKDTAEKIAIKSELWSRFKIGKDDLNQLIEESLGVSSKVKRNVEILTGKDLFNGESIGISWLISGLLPKGGVTILGADSGKGKTTLAYDCAGAVVFNEEFLGEKPTKQGTVLILSSDEPKSFAIDKLAKRGFTEDDNIIFVPNWTVNDWDVLEQAMEKYSPDLLIIDSFNSIHSNDNFDANSDRAALTLNRLNIVLEEYNSACILIHHLSKSKENKGVNKLRNSSAIAAASSMVWLMDGEGDILNFSLPKTRGTEPLDLKIKMDAEQGKFSIVEGAVYDDETKSLGDRIKLLFEKKYPDKRLEFEEIKDEITANDDSLRKALGRLVKNSTLNKGKSNVNKRKSVWYLINDQSDKKHSPSPLKLEDCPMKAETTNNKGSQTLDSYWTNTGQTLDKEEISLDKHFCPQSENQSESETQTLDNFIGQEGGGELDSVQTNDVQSVSNENSLQQDEIDITSDNRKKIASKPPFQTQDSAILCYLNVINSCGSSAYNLPSLWELENWEYLKLQEVVTNELIGAANHVNQEDNKGWKELVCKNYDLMKNYINLEFSDVDKIMQEFYKKAVNHETIEDNNLDVGKGIESVAIINDLGDFLFDYKTGIISRVLTKTGYSIWFEKKGYSQSTSIMEFPYSEFRLNHE